MNWVLVIALAIEFAAFALGVYISRPRRPPALPRRRRPGLDGGGPTLTSHETQAWTGIVHGYGPGEPAWPPARDGRIP